MFDVQRILMLEGFRKERSSNALREGQNEEFGAIDC